jgi:uncharacterized protein
MLQPFHLAIPVHDLAAARNFYGGLFGCAEGRSSDEWVDFDFFGHQIVAHLSADNVPDKAFNEVDGEQVPVRHFGVILSMAQWHSLVDRLKRSKVDFAISPDTRFAGEPGEQATFFIRDPSGNALEFKAFNDDSRIFAR